MSKAAFPKFFVARPRMNLTEWDEFRTRPAVGLPRPTGNVLYETEAAGETEQEALQNLHAVRRKEQAEAQAAKDAALQAAREREQAEKDAAPKSPPEVMPAGERCILKRSPDIDEITLDCAGPSSLFTSAWLGFEQRFFLDQLYQDDDLLQVGGAPGTGISKVERYGDLKDNISGFSVLDSNPRTVDEAPTRRFLISKFDVGYELAAKRINWLRRLELADLTIIVATGEISLECWWRVENLSAKKLREFYAHTVSMSSPWQCGADSVTAALPGAPATFNTDRLFKTIGVSEKLSPKSFVVHFNPRGQQSKACRATAK